MSSHSLRLTVRTRPRSSTSSTAWLSASSMSPTWRCVMLDFTSACIVRRLARAAR
ncbi:hypothetical protein [Nannocystis pusilla]|uniref:hypothetical protein n=1 Tax=Nannocystis pusilla TaxID=889268 RepID=UPI003B7E593E